MFVSVVSRHCGASSPCSWSVTLLAICTAMDADGDGVVRINALITAVQRALLSCG
jgi:hypothetical protein